VYDNTARGVVDSSLQGYNATIFAYGQVGGGGGGVLVVVVLEEGLVSKHWQCDDDDDDR
jgi:hypothetical protein